MTAVLVIGVALGVTTLMVVLSVMKGLELEMKSKILGFTPHITVSHLEDGHLMADDGYEDILDGLIEHPSVESGYPLVEAFVLMEVNGFERPVRYRSFNTEDPERVAAMDAMLDREQYPGSSADLGFEPEGVFSGGLMRSLGLKVGDVVNIYSSQNFQEIKRTFDETKYPPVTEAYADQLESMKAIMQSAYIREGELELYELAALQEVDQAIYDMQLGEIREIEIDKLEQARLILVAAEETGVQDQRSLPAGSAGAFVQRINELATLDLKAFDNESLGELESVVLPREVLVKGGYLSSAHITAPDVFLPLELGMEMKGLESGVEQLALTLVDPYKAQFVAAELSATLPEGWWIKAWQDDYSEWNRIIATEQKMMSFVLSIIMVIVGFCISAVMFTVTLQKKQEIGVMKALGAKDSQISGVFLIQGVIVGIIGVTLGLILGWLVIENRGPIQDALMGVGADVFPANMHGLNEIPAYTNPVTCVYIAVGSFLLCVIAAILPAWSASRNDPARSLRGL